MGSDEQSGDAFKGVAQLLANFFKVNLFIRCFNFTKIDLNNLLIIDCQPLFAYFV